MVGIRRKPASRLRVVSNNKSSSSSGRSSTAVAYCARTVLIGLVALYGCSVIVSLLRVPSPDNVTTINTIRGHAGAGAGAGAGGPMGVEDRLKNSHLRIPVQPSNTAGGGVILSPKDLANDLAAEAAAKPATDGSQQQKPPPPIKKYDHHLEEPDIHMQHPDLPKREKPVDDGYQSVTGNNNNNKNDSNHNNKGAPIHHDVLDQKGTGPTNVAYVRDLELEREKPAFRLQSVLDHDASDTVATMVQELKVTPCLHYDHDANGHPTRWNVKAPCLDPDTPQIVYNAANFGRTWCGQEIGPRSAVIMTEHCNDSTVHLFPQDKPPLSGEGMPPMILKSTKNKIQDESTLLTVKDCDIPCLEEPGLELVDNGIYKRYLEGEPWEIRQTRANAYVEPDARVERTDYRRDIYYSTQSFVSSVPLTFYDPDQYSMRDRPAIAYDSAKPKALYMVSHICNSPGTKRQKYFAALSNIFPIDSMGSCHHNTEVPDGMTMDTLEGRIEIMKQYRFVLAFDKTKEKDHLDPLIWESLLAGSVPVVVGAENMNLHLPEHSVIESGSYGDWDELAQAVKEVNDNQEAWESYQTWRTNETALAQFEATYEFAKTSPTCRICRWGYAKKYGLGWDQGKQQVTETRLSRALCTTSEKQGLASKPFQEEWISRNDDDATVVSNQGTSNGDDGESCSPTAESVIDNGHTYKIHRSMVEHDRVIDMIITDIERETTKQELVLRLHFPGVRNSDRAHFVNTHTTVHGLIHGPLVSSVSIQDDFSKVTVLADWITSITSPSDGVIEIVVVEAHENEEHPTHPLSWGADPTSSSTIPKRLRVIIEDMNIIHDKMTEYFPSSFAKTMIQDFVDPLEIYYADS